MGTLLLFEALELRSEYDARIKTLRECLPESREGRSRWGILSHDDIGRRPAPGFDVKQAREQVRKLELKRRKLNSAIQEANFHFALDFRGETMSLAEALELRKGLNDRIGELHTLVVEAAYERVIHKEDRDIPEENDVSYADSVEELDHKRVEFRELNRKIRTASFEVKVKYQDEPAEETGG